jgi:hypothetical protein
MEIFTGQNVTDKTDGVNNWRKILLSTLAKSESGGYNPLAIDKDGFINGC